MKLKRTNAPTFDEKKTIAHTRTHWLALPYITWKIVKLLWAPIYIKKRCTYAFLMNLSVSTELCVTKISVSFTFSFYFFLFGFGFGFSSPSVSLCLSLFLSVYSYLIWISRLLIIGLCIVSMLLHISKICTDSFLHAVIELESGGVKYRPQRLNFSTSI